MNHFVLSFASFGQVSKITGKWKTIYDMVEKNGSLTGGTIFDFNNGKVYKCDISNDAKNNNLKVRGSLDKGGLLGRLQVLGRSNSDINTIFYQK